MGPAKRGPIWVPDRVPICTKCIEAHEVWPMGAHGATTKKKKLCSMWVPDRVPTYGYPIGCPLRYPIGCR